LVGVNHIDILNHLIAYFRYNSYLEIGVADPRLNFNAVQINDADKIGVDPDPVGSTYQMTSDAFFASNKNQFDLIFIDGLHHQDQVYRDILNALKALNPNGTIVCHDMNPTTYEEQAVPRQQLGWTGDCWRAWVKLRTERPDLDMKVVDTDCGCGIIRVGTQAVLSHIPTIEWNDFVAHRTELLNLISIEEFNKLFSI
jgi:SAM-dependent methyltransferase